MTCSDRRFGVVLHDFVNFGVVLDAEDVGDEVVWGGVVAFVEVGGDGVEVDVVVRLGPETGDGFLPAKLILTPLKVVGLPVAL